MRIGRTDEPLGEGYDVSAWWFVAMFALMYWLIFSEPREITGDHVSKKVVLGRLPWGWVPALASWLVFCATFNACKALDVEGWSDLDSDTLRSLVLGVLWRFALWAAIAAASVLICGIFDMTYDSVMWFILVAAIINAVVGFFRRRPEELWD